MKWVWLLIVFFLGYWAGNYYEYYSIDGHVIDGTFVWPLYEKSE